MVRSELVFSRSPNGARTKNLDLQSAEMTALGRKPVLILERCFQSHGDSGLTGIAKKFDSDPVYPANARQDPPNSARFCHAVQGSALRAFM